MVELKCLKMYEDSRIPTKAHEKDAGYDFYVHHMENENHCRVDEVTLYQGDKVVCHTGIRCRIPEGYFIQLNPRSGLGTKYGVNLANTPGTIDESYIGEIIITLVKNLPGSVTIKAGDRVAQGVLLPVPESRTTEVFSEEELGETDRGSNGFGSSGRN